MSRWPKVPLGTVCDINPKQNGAERLAPDTEVSFVPMAAVDEASGRIATKETRPLDSVTKGYTPFRNDDVLFAKITPCMENGKAAIARDLTNGVGFGSTEFHVLRPKPELLREWVFAFIRQPAFRDLARANFAGTAGQQRVPADFLKQIQIPLPPLPEQERLVRILAEVEALRRLRVKADERTASLVSALFQVVVGQPADGHPPIPIGPLSSGLTTVETRRPEATPDEAFDYVDISSVDAASGRIVAPKRMLGAEAPSRARQLVRSGDVLVSTVIPNLRATARVPTQLDGAIASTGFCVLRPHQIIVSEYLEALVRQQWFTDYLVSNTTGASYPAVTDAIVKSAAVPIPPVSLQNTFAARVAEIRELEATQAVNRKRLDDLFQSLLHRAFQGEL